MRLLSRLLVVFAVCLVAIALPAAPVQAQGTYIVLSPDEGVPGEEIRVRGINFTASEWVDIYYDGKWIDDIITYSDGDFPWVTFEVPESPSGNHQVRAEDEFGIYANKYFTVEPGLTVEPEEGPLGTIVTVEGHGFAEDEENIELRYYLNGDDYETVADNIEADEDGYWEMSFKIPTSTRGIHYIDAQGDDSSFAKVEDASFEVTPEISILDGPSGSIIEEPSGSPGDTITITGCGFADSERDIEILFDGEAVATLIRADDTGCWEEDFEVPERPKGIYSVTAEGERTPKEDISELSFEIGPGLVLSPDEGHVGMNLTVTGGGFAANEDVVIRYDGSQKATTTANNKGSFVVSFPVPESQHGDRPLTAEADGELQATASFALESDPPGTPELISPTDEDRVGFIGRLRPTFEWSGVSDDSGVRYSLQIATSSNVTATGFADPIVTISNIAGTNYTLEKTEALPYGTYYWIVQAVDGAENESGWTEEARSFRAGVMPLWAFIVIMVAVAGGIGVAVYFFVIRRRIYYY